MTTLATRTAPQIRPKLYVERWRRICSSWRKARWFMDERRLFAGLQRRLGGSGRIVRARGPCRGADQPHQSAHHHQRREVAAELGAGGLRGIRGQEVKATTGQAL